MATYRKRGTNWQVQVRLDGYPPVNKTFKRKVDAERWARQTETELQQGSYKKADNRLRETTVGDLLVRYRETVAPTKRGFEEERYRLNRLLKYPIAKVRLCALTPSVVSEFRDARLKKVTGSSVRREFRVLQHCFEIARIEWGYEITNPVRQIKIPSEGPSRNRRLAEGELEALLSGCQQFRSPWLQPIILFAVETAMRRGEIISLEWPNVDLETRTVHLPITKNGEARTIPLSSVAVGILQNLSQSDGQVFPVTGNAIRLAWNRLRARTEMEDLRFHDLRHEAISRLFEKGLSIPEVALISGHKDVRMLFRYTHMKPEMIIPKLG